MAKPPLKVELGKLMADQAAPGHNRWHPDIPGEKTELAALWGSQTSVARSTSQPRSSSATSSRKTFRPAPHTGAA
jgi:hypothetical protein